MEPGSMFWFIPIAAILGGISVAIAGIISNTRLREARIREERRGRRGKQEREEHAKPRAHFAEIASLRSQ